MPSRRECLRRKGATTQSCFVFKVNSGLAPEVSGRPLRSYYEASIEMGVRGLNNSRMVQWTIPVPSVQPSGIDITRLPVWRKQHCAAEGPCLSSKVRWMLCSCRLMASVRTLGNLTKSSSCWLSTSIRVTFRVVGEAVGCCCSDRSLGEDVWEGKIQKGKRRGARGRRMCFKERVSYDSLNWGHCVKISLRRVCTLDMIWRLTQYLPCVYQIRFWIKLIIVTCRGILCH